MISIQQDPNDQNKIIVSSTVVLFLEKVALQALSDEIKAAIVAQAKKDLKQNKEVQKVVAEQATAHLLKLLTGGGTQ